MWTISHFPGVQRARRLVRNMNVECDAGRLQAAEGHLFGAEGRRSDPASPTIFSLVRATSREAWSSKGPVPCIPGRPGSRDGCGEQNALAGPDRMVFRPDFTSVRVDSDS